jgi:Ca2+-binding EF-hand superfamily protein
MSLEIASKLAILLNETESSNELRQLWEALDKNSDGKVSSKEWGSAVFQNKDLLSKYFGGASMSEIGHAFNRIDSNKSDALTWDEFSSDAKSFAAASNLAAAMATDDGSAELKGLWDTLDKDGDGKVSSQEWGRAVYKNQDLMKKHFGGNTLSEIGHAFNRIDSDNNDSLTWIEFAAEVKTYGAVLDLKKTLELEEGKAEFKALFDTLDKDDSGKISGKEWGSAVYSNQDVMKKYFGGSTLKEIGTAFNRIDTDDNDQLTWDEFVATLME